MKKYVYEIRETWSTENDGNSYHISDIIVNNSDQVMQYLKDNYNIENMDDMSDGISFIFEKSGKYWVSDHGNTHEVTSDCEQCDKSDDGLCEDHFYMTESITAEPYYIQKGKGKPATKQYLDYLKSGKHFTSIVDMTEQ